MMEKKMKKKIIIISVIVVVSILASTIILSQRSNQKNDMPIPVLPPQRNEPAPPIMPNTAIDSNMGIGLPPNLSDQQPIDPNGPIVFSPSWDTFIPYLIFGFRTNEAYKALNLSKEQRKQVRDILLALQDQNKLPTEPVDIKKSMAQSKQRLLKRYNDFKSILTPKQKYLYVKEFEEQKKEISKQIKDLDSTLHFTEEQKSKLKSLINNYEGDIYDFNTQLKQMLTTDQKRACYQYENEKRISGPIIFMDSYMINQRIPKHGFLVFGIPASKYKALNLSDEQKRDINTLRKDYVEQYCSLKPIKATGPDDAMNQISNTIEERDKAADQLYLDFYSRLTDKQKDAYEKAYKAKMDKDKEKYKNLFDEFELDLNLSENQKAKIISLIEAFDGDDYLFHRESYNTLTDTQKEKFKKLMALGLMDEILCGRILQNSELRVWGGSPSKRRFPGRTKGAEIIEGKLPPSVGVMG